MFDNNDRCGRHALFHLCIFRKIDRHLVGRAAALADDAAVGNIGNGAVEFEAGQRVNGDLDFLLQRQERDIELVDLDRKLHLLVRSKGKGGT